MIEFRGGSWSLLPTYHVNVKEEIQMHNVLSRSQLDEWRHQEDQKLNDYYECLIESTLSHDHEGKKICKQILK